MFVAAVFAILSYEQAGKGILSFLRDYGDLPEVKSVFGENSKADSGNVRISTLEENAEKNESITFWNEKNSMQAICGPGGRM